MVSNINRREKCYVRVVAEFDLNGAPEPLAIIWEDGRRFEIDKVTDRRWAASMKVGGHGMRYTVEIGGKAKHLWQDDHGWYVERIVHDGITAM